MSSSLFLYARRSCARIAFAYSKEDSAQMSRPTERTTSQGSSASIFEPVVITHRTMDHRLNRRNRLTNRHSLDLSKYPVAQQRAFAPCLCLYDINARAHN
jgi:hypothetical protein